MKIFHGVDIVHIPSFSEQLGLSGTKFANVFSTAELSDAKRTVDEFSSLAGKWAAKEAFIKAWSQMVSPNPPVILPEDLDFSQIETIKDLHSRPQLRLSSIVKTKFEECEKYLHEEDSSDFPSSISLSISHDQNYAIATVIISS